ncbi:MAG TPA: hydantoinase B/oxoprolinase family protein [Rhodospirillales bacterium]|jgi:5-oxoprolinase (ATP-hydrolysing)|nr:hydantoinase B/oxoprolinase family protein [Rhodospirillales bacterium]
MTNTPPSAGPPSASGGGWQFWIDRGGTFTDVVARRPDGRVVTRKLLSADPERYDDAAIEGIRTLLGLAASAAIPADAIKAVKMGTTVATNALLERQGEETVLVITKGFGDALRIGYQNRPRLFARHIVLPSMLYVRVIEVNERIGAKGEVVDRPDLERARADLQAAFDEGIRSAAIVFMHAYRYPQHEEAVAGLARDIGFTWVSASHAVSPLMKLVSRGDTTVVDAYLSPLLRRHVDTVAAELGGARLMFMRSNGGLAKATLFKGKDSILSGPAGGVVGMAQTAALAGFVKVIGFDMGGTSTDVSHFNGEFERTFETLVAGVRMRAPMMHIHTVAAGGGSILHFDGARFRVGPDSAGADPGPACYRRQGPATVTDCNVMLGKIQPKFFPAVFGKDGDQPLDADAAGKHFTALAGAIQAATGDIQAPEQVAEGFLMIAVDNMANTIKRISVQRGYDVSEYTLNCFGGAGGQHACLVADALTMSRILVHPLAGVLSAYGMGLANMTAMRGQSIEAEIETVMSGDLATALDALEREARSELHGQGVAMETISVLRKSHLRYAGTDTALMVNFTDSTGMAADFEAAHRRRFGFVIPDRSLIVEAISVEAVAASEAVEEPKIRAVAGTRPAQPLDTVSIYSGGAWHEAAVYRRHSLSPADVIDGPAIIVDAHATTVVEPGWRAELTAFGHLILSRRLPRPAAVAIGAETDPVMLEIFNNLFMSIAEQMGATLANTAHSVNIKERLDFSCAVFDQDGQLVANAPHIPVHLGSMGESVETVITERLGAMKPGDVYALNAPYNGGTHLPDITVITPVFGEDSKEPLFFVGSRGHHADIGGITPGSMPPDSTSIDDEGVLIDNFLLIETGRFRDTELRELLSSGPWPARNPEQNIADLRAQIAANEKGARELKRMVDHYGLEVVRAYMGHVQNNAEESVRRVIDVLDNGAFALEMDDGSAINVKITIDKKVRVAVIDFTGTSAQRPGNFNAPFAVCRAAVLYVFRTLVNDDIPLNAGCMKPLRIIVPKGSMLNPRYPAAVVAGNVETSQAVVDALYGALGVMAASQGTMNNFTFGNDDYQYYETICGGSGAGPDFNGTDAIHTHMTNSRLTDPEVLELRYPVRVEEFSIRACSAGGGRFRGGNGVRRRIRFLETMTAAILSGRRRRGPPGMAGGGGGRVGRNTVERARGSIDILAATDKTEVDAGDVFIIETPGGGGYGETMGKNSDKRKK